MEVPQSVRVAAAEPARNWSYAGGVTTYTLDSFMSFGAIRATDDFLVTEDSIEGVIWESSNAATPSNITGVRAPTLIAAMGAHYFIAPSEMYYQRSPSADKTMVVVEGATHGFQPCRPCERTPGEFGDTMKTLFDYTAEWLRARFVE
jgi:hypothetical protein